ncbi:hypothetical protein ACUSJC_16790, partial [Flavobacterium sp. U410]
MKTIFKIIFLFLISLNVKCQTITAIVPYKTKTYDAVNGAYFKDLDNEFPFWLGTWEGTANNKKYTFTFVLFQSSLSQFANGIYFYKDFVAGKLKVTDLITNQVIYDESSFTDLNDFLI